MTVWSLIASRLWRTALNLNLVQNDFALNFRKTYTICKNLSCGALFGFLSILINIVKNILNAAQFFVSYKNIFLTPPLATCWRRHW